MLCTRFATILGWYEYQLSRTRARVGRLRAMCGSCGDSSRSGAGLRLEQVGDGLAQEVAVDRGAEISEVAERHQAAQQRPEGAAQPDSVAGGDRGVGQDPAELLLHILVVAVVSLDVQGLQG